MHHVHLGRVCLLLLLGLALQAAAAGFDDVAKTGPAYSGDGQGSLRQHHAGSSITYTLDHPRHGHHSHEHRHESRRDRHERRHEHTHHKRHHSRQDGSEPYEDWQQEAPEEEDPSGYDADAGEGYEGWDSTPPASYSPGSSSEYQPDRTNLSPAYPHPPKGLGEDDPHRSASGPEQQQQQQQQRPRHHVLLNRGERQPGGSDSSDGSSSQQPSSNPGQQPQQQQQPATGAHDPQQQQQQQQQSQEPLPDSISTEVPDRQPGRQGSQQPAPQPKAPGSGPGQQLPGYGGGGYGSGGFDSGGYDSGRVTQPPSKDLEEDIPDPTGPPPREGSKDSAQPVKRQPGGYGRYGWYGAPGRSYDDEFPDPTAGESNPGPDAAGSNSTQQPGYGYWPVYKPPSDAAGEPDYGDTDLDPGERRFGEPARGTKEAPVAVNGSCKVGGAESNCQGSGVVLDNSTSTADGVVTAIADCVEEAGNIYQKGGYCDLVCTDEADYKVVQKTSEKAKSGYDGQILCEARRVTDSVSINGICSLIPVATCCEPDNPQEGLVFLRSLGRGRRGSKRSNKPQYQQ